MSTAILKRVIAAAALLFVLAVPAGASAYDLKTSVDCSKAADSAVCSTTPGTDPLTGTNGVIHKVTLIIAVIAGVAATIIMVIGGIKYITSNGESDAVSSAKKTILYAAIGLAVIVLGQTIITLVINRI